MHRYIMHLCKKFTLLSMSIYYLTILEGYDIMRFFQALSTTQLAQLLVLSA